MEDAHAAEETSRGDINHPRKTLPQLNHLGGNALKTLPDSLIHLEEQFQKSSENAVIAPSHLLY
ncbi:MAG TPA: hypothetical protein VGM01_14610 [Ktedonobacteraceae bacterium]|jgi:hypothetical protein